MHLCNDRSHERFTLPLVILSDVCSPTIHQILLQYLIPLLGSIRIKFLQIEVIPSELCISLFYLILHKFESSNSRELSLSLILSDFLLLYRKYHY